MARKSTAKAPAKTEVDSAVAERQKRSEEWLASRRTEHNARMVKALSGAALVVGARAVNPKISDEGIQITFEPSEQAEITKAVLKVLKARK